MEINESRRQELIKKYRIPVFETKRQYISKINNLISDEDLVDMIEINNEDMEKMIYSDNIDQEKLTKLAYANLNFYIIANYRKIGISNKNILLLACSFIDKKYSNNGKLPALVESILDEGKVSQRGK